MKIIAIGDPHFRTDNIPEVNMFMDRLEALCIEEKPDFIVILGDVLHTHERLHTIPLNKAYEFVQRMRAITQTFILVGNHDMTSNTNFLNDHHWMNGLKEWKNVCVVDTVKHFQRDGFNFVFVPYVPPSRFLEALNTENKDWKEADIIFAHQEFYGCKMGAIVSTDGDRWEEDLPYIVSGHIHSNQTIQNNIYYPGSSMQHAFGESDHNIIPILTLQKGLKYDLNEVDLGLPRKKIIYTDIEKIDQIVLKDTEDKVKVTISGVYDDFKAFKKTKQYRDMIKKGTKVVFKSKKSREEKRNENNIENESSMEGDENNFSKILHQLIMKEKNSYLYQVYEKIVNNKEIEDDDILIL